MTQTIGNAIAERQNQPLSPYMVVTKERATELSQMLPTHIASESWLRITAGALKTGKVESNGRTELENAAANNPAAFVKALRTAASLGLQPGTEQFYFTTVRNWRNQNRTEILGIVGYQGYVELMYRAGAVESVVVEVVYTTDKFDYIRGVHQRPIHETDWTVEQRGDLMLAYAYANMKGGAVSKVVVLTKADIALIRSKSASWTYDQKNNKETSPWTTNPSSMWLKTAARQLAKWVPTSASYLTEQLRAVRAADQPGPTVPDIHAQPPIPEHAQVDISDPDEVIDGEVMDEPGDAAHQAPQPPEPTQEPPGLLSHGQKVQLGQLYRRKGFTSSEQALPWTRQVIGRDDLTSTAQLSGLEADRVIAALKERADPAEEPPADEPEPEGNGE